MLRQVLAGDVDGASRSLADPGTNPDAVDPYLRTTPLTAAAEAGCIALVDALIEASADVNLVPAGGEAPLTFAVQVGDAELIELLLAAGANPSLGGGSDLPSPLHHAVGIGRVTILDRLLRFTDEIDIGATGGDPLATGEDIGHGSPLEFAAEIPCLRCADLLVAAGADVTRTSLYRAVLHGHVEMAQLLVDAGASTDAATGGRTIRDLAHELGHRDILDMLED